jgi:hypothetical protein
MSDKMTFEQAIRHAAAFEMLQALVHLAAHNTPNSPDVQLLKTLIDHMEGYGDMPRPRDPKPLNQMYADILTLGCFDLSDAEIDQRLTTTFSDRGQLSNLWVTLMVQETVKKGVRS